MNELSVDHNYLLQPSDRLTCSYKISVALSCVVRFDRKMLSISESIDDMEAYTMLTDQVYYQILCSSDPELEEVSQHIYPACSTH